MKKKLFAIILSGMLFIASGTFVACDDFSDTHDDIYNTLNSLVAQPQSQVALTISTILNGEKLNGTFTAVQEDDGIRVTYAYEQLSTFEDGEDGYIIPDSYITTYQGTVLIAEGKVVEQNGDAADIAIEQITAAGLEFEKDYFSNVIAQEGFFQAKVISPSDFLQTEISCTEMRVEACYMQESIDLLTISYTSSSGAQVVLSYTFG